MGLIVLGAEHGVFKRPSSSQSMKYPIVVCAVELNPFAQWLANAIKVFDAVRALVAMLLFVSCPPAIAWLVIAVVIDSVKRIALRCLPHIGEEPLKAAMRIAPAFANFDAASPIVRIARLVRFVATPPHINPDAVRPSLGKAVRSSPIAGGLSPVTTAGLALPTDELIPTHKLFGSANAHAAPHRATPFAVSAMREFDNAKAPKRHAG